MPNTFLVSDWHANHANILNFLNSDGSRVRPFDSVEEMNETLIENHNKIVKPNDRVINLGDVAMSKSALPLISRFNGKKKLVFGNHDIFPYSEYLPYFEDIAGYHVFGDERIICSHIPISQESRGRFKLNVHGHTHCYSNQSLFYYNVCVEKTNFAPIPYDDVLKYLDTWRDALEEAMETGVGLPLDTETKIGF